MDGSQRGREMLIRPALRYGIEPGVVEKLQAKFGDEADAVLDLMMKVYRRAGTSRFWSAPSSKTSADPTNFNGRAAES